MPLGKPVKVQVLSDAPCRKLKREIGEMADAGVLEAPTERCMGSSPLFPTNVESRRADMMELAYMTSSKGVF